ncbi:MAG: hypothetical protein ACYCOU_01565, partial [Sulfobacillus sp.]
MQELIENDFATIKRHFARSAELARESEVKTNALAKSLAAERDCEEEFNKFISSDERKKLVRDLLAELNSWLKPNATFLWQRETHDEWSAVWHKVKVVACDCKIVASKESLLFTIIRDGELSTHRVHFYKDHLDIIFLPDTPYG